MDAPSVPEAEAKRLTSLRNLNLLDTPAEERFDRLVRLAARTLRVPLATLSLMDDVREWIKSSHGLAPIAIPRDASFCAQAIQSDEPFVIPDAGRDPRFAENPLVSGEPRVRFCAAVPLHAEDGQRVGALAVMDRQAGKLGAEDQRLLHDLGAVAELELQVHRMSPGQVDLVAERRDLPSRTILLDPATRVWTREAILDILARELARAKREAAPIGFIHADLDTFQAVVKAHGDAGGQFLLAETARRFRAALRPYDAIGRSGTEGFLAILPGADAIKTMGAADRIRATVSGKPIPIPGGTLAATLSMGVTAAERQGRADVDSLVHAAEEALLAARRRGGNRIELSGASL